MASKRTAETAPYKTPPNSDANATTEAQLNRDAQDDTGTAGNHAGAYKGGTRASYTPSSSINEHAYGKDGKTNILGKIPEVQVGGSFEVGQVPAMPGTLKIGDNKNVSTPVSGG